MKNSLFVYRARVSNITICYRSLTSFPIFLVEKRSSNNSNVQDNREVRNNTSIIQEEPRVDPYKTYNASPIPGDVGESTELLSEEFKARPSEFINRQTGQMESSCEKSKLYLSELLSDRAEERDNLEVRDLRDYDKETKSLIEDEISAIHRELDTIKQTRDDVLDIIDGTRQHSGSNYDSDYVSVTSQNRLDNEYNNLDPRDREIKEDHKTFTDNILQGLPIMDTDDESNSSEVDVSSVSSEAESSNKSNQDIPETGASNYINDLSVDSTVATSSKRTLEDSESEDSNPNKKARLEGGSEHISDNVETRNNEPQDNLSPLDYVLDQQQFGPYDVSDDMD